MFFIYESVFFFFQAEDGIRDLVRSRGLGDVYKRQVKAKVFDDVARVRDEFDEQDFVKVEGACKPYQGAVSYTHLTLPTSDLV